MRSIAGKLRATRNAELTFLETRNYSTSNSKRELCGYMGQSWHFGPGKCDFGIYLPLKAILPAPRFDFFLNKQISLSVSGGMK